GSVAALLVTDAQSVLVERQPQMLARDRVVIETEIGALTGPDDEARHLAARAFSRVGTRRHLEGRTDETDRIRRAAWRGRRPLVFLLRLSARTHLRTSAHATRPRTFRRGSAPSSCRRCAKT